MPNDPPAGFEPLFRSSPFSELCGPMYSRGSGANLVLGLRIAEKHTNSRGFAHAGVLTTLCDLALGYTVAFYAEPPASYVTVHLDVDFASSAKIGDWMEARVDVQKRGSRLAFANAYLTVGDERIVRASAVFAGKPG